MIQTSTTLSRLIKKYFLETVHGTKSLDDVLRTKKRVLIKENLYLRDGKFSDLEKNLEHRISVASLSMKYRS